MSNTFISPASQMGGKQYTEWVQQVYPIDYPYLPMFLILESYHVGVFEVEDIEKTK